MENKWKQNIQNYLLDLFFLGSSCKGRRVATCLSRHRCTEFVEGVLSFESKKCGKTQKSALPIFITLGSRVVLLFCSNTHHKHFYLSIMFANSKVFGCLINIHIGCDCLIHGILFASGRELMGISSLAPVASGSKAIEDWLRSNRHVSASCGSGQSDWQLGFARLVQNKITICGPQFLFLTFLSPTGSYSFTVWRPGAIGGASPMEDEAKNQYSKCKHKNHHSKDG